MWEGVFTRAYLLSDALEALCALRSVEKGVDDKESARIKFAVRFVLGNKLSDPHPHGKFYQADQRSCHGHSPCSTYC